MIVIRRLPKVKKIDAPFAREALLLLHTQYIHISTPNQYAPILTFTFTTMVKASQSKALVDASMRQEGGFSNNQVRCAKRGMGSITAYSNKVLGTLLAHRNGRSNEDLYVEYKSKMNMYKLLEHMVFNVCDSAAVSTFGLTPERATQLDRIADEQAKEAVLRTTPNVKSIPQQ